MADSTLSETLQKYYAEIVQYYITTTIPYSTDGLQATHEYVTKLQGWMQRLETIHTAGLRLREKMNTEIELLQGSVDDVLRKTRLDSIGVQVSRGYAQDERKLAGEVTVLDDLVRLRKLRADLAEANTFCTIVDRRIRLFQSMTMGAALIRQVLDMGFSIGELRKGTDNASKKDGAD